MPMRLPFLLAVLALPFTAVHSFAAISTFTDRTSFNAAVAPTPLTIETFLTTGLGGQIPNSPGFYNIPANTLNSSTILGSLPAGVIQPGVTYSSPVDSKNLFIIDAGGGFDGGFLEGVRLGTPIFPLTITFDNDVSAFAFDTRNFMGTAFTVQIKFSDAADYTATLVGLPSSSGASLFEGFKSSSADITQVIITGSDRDSFALDNFTFTNDPLVTAVTPEPATITMFGFGTFCLMVTTLRRRRTR
jgi:hypothetical protein